MKNLKTLLIAAIMFVGTSQAINAQSKTAHVDVSEIMTKMPAVLDAQKALEKESQKYQAEYKTMGDEYQTKVKKYEAEAATAGETVNLERQKEVQDMEKRIQEYGQNAQKGLQTKEAELMKPIEEKVKTAIQKVGKTKGFQYILNSAGLLLADGTNLTADVKKELGFK
jgi:outer membrane protein